MKTSNIFKYWPVKSITCLTLIMAMATSCADEFNEPETTTGSTLVELASGDNDLNIFVAALEKTGLAAGFNNDNSGQYTIFAPSDDAFVTWFRTLSASYSAYNEAEVLSAVNNLTISSNPTIGALTSRLMYHVVTSEHKAADLTGNQVFTTLQSARLSVSKAGAEILLNANGANGAKLVIFDLDASNGVAHIIDRVLTAVSTTTAASVLGIGVNYNFNPPTVSGGTATDGSTSNFNLLAVAIKKTGLAPALLPNTSPLPDFTIFAPTDAAVISYLGAASEDAAKTAINNLSGAALTDFTNLLKYHVVAGRVLSTDLTNGQEVTTLSGGTFTVSISGSTVTLVDKNAATDAVITTANALTNAGVIHTINAVLRPN